MTEKVIKQVWRKAQVVSGYDPDVWRKDHAGAWIKCDAYGETNMVLMANMDGRLTTEDPWQSMVATMTLICIRCTGRIIEQREMTIQSLIHL